MCFLPPAVDAFEMKYTVPNDEGAPPSLEGVGSFIPDAQECARGNIWAVRAHAKEMSRRFPLGEPLPTFQDIREYDYMNRTLNRYGWSEKEGLRRSSIFAYGNMIVIMKNCWSINLKFSASLYQIVHALLWFAYNTVICLSDRHFTRPGCYLFYIPTYYLLGRRMEFCHISMHLSCQISRSRAFPSG